MLRNKSEWIKILDEANCSTPWVRRTIKNQVLNMLDPAFMNDDADTAGKFRGILFKNWEDLRDMNVKNRSGVEKFPAIAKKLVEDRVNDGRATCHGKKKPPGLVVNPFNVIDGDSIKPKFVLDLKVNKMTKKLGARLDHLTKVLPQLEDAESCAAEDISGCYDQLRLDPDSRKLCGFKFLDNYYSLNVLPFGWTCAPFVIMQIIGQVTRIVRNRGYDIGHYIGKLKNFLF